MAGEAIDTNCPSCGVRLKLPAEQAGKQARCPQCKTVFPIPTGMGPAGNNPSQPDGFDSLLNGLSPQQPIAPPQSQRDPFQSSGGDPFAMGGGLGPQGSKPPPNPFASDPYGTSPYSAAPNPYAAPATAPSLPATDQPSALPFISIITGIAGLMSLVLLCCCLPICFPLSLTAVITGHLAVAREVQNKVVAMIGLALGYLGLVFFAAWIGLNVIGAVNQQHRNFNPPAFDPVPAFEFPQPDQPPVAPEFPEMPEAEGL